MTLPEKITAVPEPTEAYLNHKQLMDYRSEREDALTWLLTFGKDPKQADGYAVSTLKTQAYRMDQFYRWMWEREGGYTVQITHEYADEWMRKLAQDDYVVPTRRTVRRPEDVVQMVGQRAERIYVGTRDRIQR